jgi:hypothetical protein
MFKTYLDDSNKASIMDFIKVTLLEKLDLGTTIANRKRKADYLLPVNAIKSVTKKDLSESSNIYYIEILKYFKPDDVEFNVGRAEAELPTDFIQIKN